MPTTSTPDAAPALADVLDLVFAAGHALAAVAAEVAARRPHEQVDPPLDSPDVMRAWRRYLTASQAARAAVTDRGHLFPSPEIGLEVFDLLRVGVATGPNEHPPADLQATADRLCARVAELRHRDRWAGRSGRAGAAGDVPAPRVEPAGQIPQPKVSPLTAAGFAMALGVPDCTGPVDAALRRLAKKDRAVFTPNPDARAGEPTKLYHTPLVWGHLVELLPGWRRLQAGRPTEGSTPPTLRRGPRNLKKIFP